MNKILSESDLERLNGAISRSRFWKPFCMTILNTGIGRGEILALRWKDIDFEKNIISVERGSINLRKITAPIKLINELSVYKAYRSREQQRIQNRYMYIDNESLVFGNREGKSYSYSGICHLLTKFLRRQGCQDMNVTITKLRQTYRKNSYVDIGIEKYRENFIKQRQKNLKSEGRER